MGRWSLWLLSVLVLTGLGLAVWQPVDIGQLVYWGERLTTRPLVLAVVAAVMVLMFAFGLPGSMGVWLIAPFNPPLIAVPLLLAVSIAGALGGYCVAARLSSDWQPSAVSSRVLAMLGRRGDGLSQVAMRLLPGFPHSAVNFGGGLLRLPLPTFVAAAMVGLGAKWTVYATAIHEIADVVEGQDVLDVSTLMPLVVLSALALIGAWLRYRWGLDR